jgi:predicted outer membrane repeat protein
MARGRRTQAVAATVALAVAAASAPSIAAVFLVDTRLDVADDTPGDGLCAATVLVGLDPPRFESRCSLRAAIQEANALPGTDTILLSPGPHPLGRLGRDEDAGATGDLDVRDDLVISGGWTCPGIDPCLDPEWPGPFSSEVGWPDSVPEVDRDRVFDIHTTGRVELSGLTIHGGRAPIGAGIRTGLGELRLTGCRVRDNVADDPALASATIAGAGIQLDGGRLEIAVSEITDNEARDPLGSAGTSEGGGLRNRGGTVLLFWSTFARNGAGDRGGAIASSGLLVGVNSTLSGNAAPSGGALYQQGAAALSLLSHVTVTGNQAETGGGLWLGAGDLRLRGSILAGNEAAAAPECHREAAAAFASDGSNVFGELALGAPGSCAGDLAGGPEPPGDASGVDARLGPLADNDGWTATHLPRRGSPAIDRGDDACVWTAGIDGSGAPIVFPLTSDQRDPASPVRPADGDGDGVARCDAGAVELVPEPAALAGMLAALLALLLLSAQRGTSPLSQRLRNPR